MTASDVADVSRVLAVGMFGWVVSGSELEITVKLLVTLATLAYMGGKAVLVWRAIIKGEDHDEKDL